MSWINGEYWLIDGQATFADGDIGDQNHQMAAFDAAIGLGENELHKLYNEGVEVSANVIDFRIAATRWLEENAPHLDMEKLPLNAPAVIKAIRDANVKMDCMKEFVALWGPDIEIDCTEDDMVAALGTAYLVEKGADEDFLKWWIHSPQSDPRDYAMEHMGWIRVDDMHFQTWVLTDKELGDIRGNDIWDYDGVDDEDKPLDQSDEEVYIEEVSTGRTFEVPLYELMNERLTAGNIKSRPEDEELMSIGGGDPEPHLSLNPPKFNAAFWRWFGDSVVRNKDGSPKVMYHGTRFDITEFSREGASKVSGVDIGGFYFTDDRDVAKRYSLKKYDPFEKYGRPRVISVFLRIENPLVIDGEKYKQRHRHLMYYAPEAKRRGHDGIIVTKTAESLFAQYMVFNPEQIKSIDNDGTWDADDPDIRSNPPVHAIRSIERRHAVTDPDHVLALAKSIRAHGWKGPPLVIWGPINWGNSRMLTGVHRMAALDLLMKKDREFAEGLNIPVLIVDQRGLSEEVIEDTGIRWDGDIGSLYDSDEIAMLLDVMGESEAAALVRDEGGDVLDADDPRIGSNPDNDVTSLDVGTKLYHGTSSPEKFRMVRGPAWFSDSKKTARAYIDFHEWRSGEMAPRVLSYRVVKAPTLVMFLDEAELEAFLVRLGLGVDAFPEELRAMSKTGYDGWIMPDLRGHTRGAKDIMLLSPKKWLELESIQEE